MMNCFVARQSGPDGLLKFDLLCWSMTSFSDNSFFIVFIYIMEAHRSFRGDQHFIVLLGTVETYIKRKSPYSEEFIIYVASTVF